MRRSILIAFVLVGGLLVARSSSAQSVTINDYGSNTGAAYGSLGQAFRDNNSSYIGCTVDASPGGTEAASCYAQGTSSWVYGSCYTTDAAIIRVIGQLTTDSSVYFAWDSSGYCSYVDVDEYSSNLPK